MATVEKKIFTVILAITVFVLTITTGGVALANTKKITVEGPVQCEFIEKGVGVNQSGRISNPNGCFKGFTFSPQSATIVATKRTGKLVRSGNKCTIYIVSNDSSKWGCLQD